MTAGSDWADNRTLYQIFNRFADLLEIQGGGDARKAASYRRAAIALRNLDRPLRTVAAVGELRSISGVGPALAAKIEEFLATGAVAALQRLASAVPDGVLQLLDLPGVGARTAGSLWRGLGIDSPRALADAAAAGRLRSLPGFGSRREAALLAAISARPAPQLLLPEALALGEALMRRVGAVPGVTAVQQAGAARRGCPLSGELTLVAAAAAVDAAAAAIAAALGELALWAAGRAPTPAGAAVTATLENGVPVRIALAPPGAFGTAQLLATGSEAHLSEMGTLPAAPDEEAVYAGLGLPWIAPELREGAGEVAAARRGLPDSLLVADDIRGELHVHTRWSDGAASVAEMAAAAADRGDRYLAITDHSRSLVIAHGLGPEELRSQRREVEACRASGAGGGMLVLQGCEVEVLRDGGLDLDDAVLGELDFVVAALHSRLGQDGPALTERALAALRHPLVDVLAHPSGRRLPERGPMPIDMDRVIEAAAAAGKALEVNGSPERCDLDGALARRARERGVPLLVDSDAHGVQGLANRRFGVLTARRGWAGPADVLNTRPPEAFLAWLRARRGG